MENTELTNIHVDVSMSPELIAGVVIVSTITATLTFMSLGIVKVGLQRMNRRLEEKAQGND